ncbi:MAG: exodeoxyribonuclease VII large subunit [Bacteroides sp.]
METTPLSLYDLNTLVKDNLNQCMPDEYWIQAELSDVRSNATGHCYLEFIQKDVRSNSLIAKAKGIIWSSTYKLLKPYFEKETGQSFVSGIKVMVKVTVVFHELYGYSLTVTDIDPTYTLGDLVKRRKEILQQLEEEGVLTLNKELEIPVFAQHIAVISSATAAGYDDFCHQLENNESQFSFSIKLFPAMMQGDKVEESIINALNAINNERDKWDVVVIIRGGGSTSDLSCFDTYYLAANCAQFPLPIITGIGHERDDTVLDSIAHTRVKTPTAAAELLINNLNEIEAKILEYEFSIWSLASQRMQLEQQKIDRLLKRIPAAVAIYKLREEHRLNSLYQQLKTILPIYCVTESQRLKFLKQQVDNASPEHLLKRGYSITLKDGKVITDVSLLKPGDKLTTRLQNGEIKSKVY